MKGGGRGGEKAKVASERASERIEKSFTYLRRGKRYVFSKRSLSTYVRKVGGGGKGRESDACTYAGCL